MARRYWLMKSEPYKYSWDDLVRDGRTFWDGVRNYEARNNLAAMEKGDLAFFYHSNKGKEIVGIAQIVAAAYQVQRTRPQNAPIPADGQLDALGKHVYRPSATL